MMKRKVPGLLGDDEDEDMEEDGPRKTSHRKKRKRRRKLLLPTRCIPNSLCLCGTSRGHKKVLSKRIEVEGS